MELKTLKEICWENKIGLREYMKFRQEAINWVKKIDNPLTDREVASKLGLYDRCETQEEVQNCLFGARRLLIIQNNLKEEDLK